MPSIATKIDFLKDLPLYKHEKPFLVMLPANKGLDPNKFRTENLEFERSEDIIVHDIRGRESEFSLEQSGFELVDQVSKHLALTTMENVEAYRTETEEFLKERLGAEKVVCWDVRIRKNQARKNDTIDLANPLDIEGPAKGAHIDSTITSGPNMVRDHLSDEDKTKYFRPGYRFRIINTWRTILPILEDRPLSFCDYRSVDKRDLVACDRVIPTRAGEIYYIRYNPEQRWHWVDGLTSDEMILMLMYDTGRGSQAKFCPHVPIENPKARADAPPRHSVETRNVVITKEA